MTLFPNVFGGGRYAVQADSHTLVIPKQPRPDQTRLDRALSLIQSFLEQSKTWAEGGHVPAWLPFRDSAEYKALTPQSNYAAAAEGAVYDPDGWYSGSGSNFEIVTGSAIATVLGGQQSPADALAQMRTKLTTLANTAVADLEGYRCPRPKPPYARPAEAPTARRPKRGPRRAPRPPGRRVPRAVPDPLPALHHRPGAVRPGDELLQHQPGAARPGLVRRLRQLRRGAAERGLLVVAVAHRVVHGPHHAAADRARASCSRCSPTGPSTGDGSSGWPSSCRTSCRPPWSR